jgi:hypothetical protein
MRPNKINLRKLVRRCRATVDRLDIPEPFDVGELCRRTGETRGRPITVAPLPLRGMAACGLWLGIPGADLIFFEADTSPAHQDHIILHELGHVLCHEQDGHLHENLLRELFPALSPELVRGALGRTRYAVVEEQEAEVFAHLVLERVWRAPVATEPAEGSTDAHAHDVLRKLARGLDG